MFYRFFYPLLFLLMAVLILLDQFVKDIIITHFKPGEIEPFLGPLDLTFTRNPNFAFGIAFMPEAFRVAFVLLMLLLFLVFFWRLQKNISVFLFAALILAGGISNLYDRVRLGYIIDYLALPYWPVFNLADVFITCGALLLSVYLIFFAPRDIFRKSSQ